MIMVYIKTPWHVSATLNVDRKHPMNLTTTGPILTSTCGLYDFHDPVETPWSLTLGDVIEFFHSFEYVEKSIVPVTKHIYLLDVQNICGKRRCTGEKPTNFKDIQRKDS